MATKQQTESDALRTQIEELQAKLAEAEHKERSACLDQMKEWQRRYGFTLRELGSAFKFRRRIPSANKE